MASQTVDQMTGKSPNLRTELEDRTLPAELPGYHDYAHHIRYKFIPWIY